MKYKDYYNFELGNRDIYSHNDILGMTVQDLFDNELPLSYQYNTIGIPKDDELMASPNTHQYTNANGKLRWRSSSKTEEDLLEEERQRVQAMQSHFGTITGGAAPEAESQDLALGSLDYMDETTQNPFDPASHESDSDQSQPVENLQDLGEGMSDEKLAQIGQKINTLYKDAVKNAPQVLESSVVEEVERPNFLERIKNKVNEFKEVGFNKEDDLNLREEVQDRYDKFVNNKTDYSAPMTKKEQLTDRLVQKGFKKSFPASSDVYTDGMTDFSRARENPNAEVMQNMDSLDEATKKALLEYGVKPNERGVYYNADSEISKKFANSPEVKKFFKENEEAIRQGKKTGGDFNFDASLKDLVINKDKMDRYASIQNAKMVDAYYDENGKKHGKFIDNVDYTRRHVKNILDGKNIINNHGYNMQEKGNFENYYIVMDILLDDSIEESNKKKMLQKILNK